MANFYEAHRNKMVRYIEPKIQNGPSHPIEESAAPPNRITPPADLAVASSVSAACPSPFPISQRRNPSPIGSKPRLPSDSFSSWGIKPGTKNVHNLWLELSEGEACLEGSSPPIRTVNFVSVRIIGKNNKILIEFQQELSDGSVRDRFRPLSEKMKPGESHEEAVVRAVKEELGSVIGGNYNGAVQIVPGSYQKQVEERNSVSYPGLPACYGLHLMEAWLEGLPEGEYWTEDEEEYADADGSRTLDKAVTVRKHYWKWVSPDSFSS